MLGSGDTFDPIFLYQKYKSNFSICTAGVFSEKFLRAIMKPRGDTNMKLKLAENIKAFRKECKMTQEQLAEAMGVTVGAVHKWESGQSAPELRLIAELADLFETSTDVLLGYEWRNGSMGAALEQIVTCRKEKRYKDGMQEAEKALKKYPNCFDIVYQSALLYAEQGNEAQDHKALTRGLVLFEMACGLIAQNSDNSISELSIRNQIARIHLRLGHIDTCVELLKKHNVCGINNAMIGMVLADCLHQPDEAMEYLAIAFAEHMENLDSLLMGYINVFVQKGDFQTALLCIQWLRNILQNSQQPDEITWFHKYDCVLLSLCAEVSCMMGDVGLARKSLYEAAKQALQFDRTNKNSIHEASLFMKLGLKNQKHYDDYGGTAMEAIERRVWVDAEVVPQLPVIWKEVKQEAAGNETV